MESLSQKLKPTQSKIARVTRCQFFFVCLILLVLLVYFSNMMLRMTFKMFKILLKSPKLTVMCGCNGGIWMSLLLASSFLVLALVLSPCSWPCSQTQSP